MKRFPEKRYYVTDYVSSAMQLLLCPWLGWETSALTLEEDEVVLRRRNCCTSSISRRPYSQLNSAETRKTCCCYKIGSDLFPLDSRGWGGLSTGCHCNRSQTMEIVQDLKHRIDGRGPVAQLKEHEFLMDRLRRLTLQVPLLLDHFRVKYPADPRTMAKIFGNNVPGRRLPQSKTSHIEDRFGMKSYDVTSWLDRLCCTKRKLELKGSEAVVTASGWRKAAKVVDRRPYSDIAYVEAERNCWACTSIKADPIRRLMPGAGWKGYLVSEIVTEFEARVNAHGHVARTKELEHMLDQVHDLGIQLPLLMWKLGLPTAFPPSQQTMEDIFGPNPPELPKFPDIVAPEHFPKKTVEVASHWENICLFLFTLGFAGCLHHSVTLLEDEVVLVKSNKCCDMVKRTPYSQMHDLDGRRACCCFHGIHGAWPRFGCEWIDVEEIAEELQARKAGRSSIEELRRREHTMCRAIELDVRADQLLGRLGVLYPPNQAAMQRIYGSASMVPPREAGALGVGAHPSSSEKVEDQSWDVTNNYASAFICCATLGLAGWQKEKLELLDEEAVFGKQNCCVSSRTRYPYSELGAVEPENVCCGRWLAVGTNVGTFSPGCGHEDKLVNDIVDGLNGRKYMRGNVAYMRQHENLVVEIIKLGIKMDLLADKLGIPLPPMQEFDATILELGASIPGHAKVTVPSGLAPGQKFQVQGPSGPFLVVVPQGAKAGQMISVEMPAAWERGETEPTRRSSRGRSSLLSCFAFSLL